MLNFADYVQQAFAASSRWDRDNSYGALNASARSLLDFSIPITGITLNFASLASPNFATCYALSNTGNVDGSLSYLYSSLPLHIAAKSGQLPLRRIIPGYRQLYDLRDLHNPTSSPHTTLSGRPPTLLYGRLYLPTSHLEALYLRRLSPTSQLKISCISSSELKDGGSILFLFSRDLGKYSTEWLYSTDSALLGVRGLYNFGPDPRQLPPSSDVEPAPKPAPTSSPLPSAASLREGRFSAGAEVYYGILNKSGGASMGLRFATLPQHTGFPYTMTLTLNPLMGNLSATYAVRAGPALALCSRFNFNFYSYESDYQLGVELWRRKPRLVDEVEWAKKILREPGRGGWGELKDEITGDKYEKEKKREELVNVILSDATGGIAGDAGMLTDETNLEQKWAPTELGVDNPNGFGNAATAGVLKARINQDGGLGLLWEGRLKELLCSAGVTIDFKRREQIFRGVGLELQYSS